MKLFGPIQKSLLVLAAAVILYAVVAGVDWYGARRELEYFNDLRQVAPPGVVDAMMDKFLRVELAIGAVLVALFAIWFTLQLKRPI